MQEALKRTDRFMSDELAWKRYLDTEIARLDYNSMIEGVREEVREEERAKAFKQDLQRIKKSLAAGIKPEVIAEVMGIPLNEVLAAR